MSSFDEAFLGEVRDRNDIVSVVGDYVALRKAGTSWKGLCPFHGEKSPSFHVHPDRKFFYCFGCQTGGDVISFVREINGYSFPEAVRHLAERAGIAMPVETARVHGMQGGQGFGGESRVGQASRSARDGFYAINRVAHRFYIETLDAMEGAVCRDYLRGRGIARETVERFGLGCAPDRWDGLVGALERERCDLRVAESLGLLVKRPSGPGYYDRFRHRLMFPIRNIAGEVLGFSGRTLSDDKEQAKYVNSPDSPVYQKGDNLYGLFEARQAIRKAGRAIFVEGNVDLLRLAQDGFPEVVAPLGTALTPAQCRLVKRFVPQAVALYDGDGAGREAAKKAAALSLAEGLALGIATLPDGEDPDTFMAKQGKDALSAILDRAVPSWEHLVDRAISETRAMDGVQGARLAVERLAPVLVEIANPDERELFERMLAETLRLEVKAVRDITRGAARTRVQPREPEVPMMMPEVREAPLGPIDLKLLELLVLVPEARALYMGRDVESLVVEPRTRALAAAIADVEGDLSEAMAVLPPGVARDQVFKRLAEAPPPPDGVAAFEAVLKSLRRDAIERQLDAIRRDERRAWLSKDDEVALSLSIEKSKLERQLEGLKAIRD